MKIGLNGGPPFVLFVESVGADDRSWTIRSDGEIESYANHSLSPMRKPQLLPRRTLYWLRYYWKVPGLGKRRSSTAPSSSPPRPAVTACGETRTAAALTPQAVWDAVDAAKDGDVVQLPEGTDFFNEEPKPEYYKPYVYPHPFQVG
jgi:hypothetical protein